MRTFLFEVWEGLLIALRAIRVQKLRAVLTTLGIIIGILSITTMATVVNGIEKGFEEDLASLGTDVLYIEKWPWVNGPGFKWWNYINRPRIKADLAEVIDKRSQLAVATTPVVRTGRTVSYESTSLPSIQIIGASASYPEVHTVDLTDGYFYSEFEDRNATNVCILGAEVAAQLFPIQDPMGKTIRIAGNRFQVIGLLKRQGSGADSASGEDVQIKIPYSTFSKLFGTTWRDVSLQVRVSSAEVIEDAKDELTGILRVARGLDAKEENDFEINEQQSLREQIAPIKTAIYSIGLGLTALALLVGGIGVMNIMFVSVKERTREIGIRKAVGARRRTILIQFLIEAIIVCMLGGIIGIGCSFLLTLLVQTFLPATMDMGVVAIAFGICMAIGTLFGIAPAWTGAKAEPIAALRYE